MVAGVLSVAKKRSGDASERAQRKSPDEEPRTTLFSVKGRMSWLDWVDALARFDRASRAELLDRALARYAREIGFQQPPPER